MKVTQHETRDRVFIQIEGAAMSVVTKSPDELKLTETLVTEADKAIEFWGDTPPTVSLDIALLEEIISTINTNGSKCVSLWISANDKPVLVRQLSGEGGFGVIMPLYPDAVKQ